MKKKFVNVNSMLKNLLLLSTLFILIFTQGCAETPKKIETRLFNEANYQFTKGRFELARANYQDLLDQFPDSKHTNHSLLGTADSYYMEAEYQLAIPIYERFIERYPLNPLTGRALFFKGMSYYKDIQIVQRDQQNTREALKVFREFSMKYPDSYAVTFARENSEKLEDKLAQKQLYIIEFYYNIDAFGACIIRVDEFIEESPSSIYIHRALLLKGKAYFEEQSFEKAKNVFELIIKDFGNTLSGKMAVIELKKLETVDKS